MTRRTRWIAIIAGIPALLLVAALIAVYVMLQPRHFTATLRDAAKGAGLQLSLAAPAQPSIWPQPGVVLKGVTLTSQDSQTPLLLATRLRLVVPWHTVLGGKTTISALQLDAPRVDIDAVRQFLSGKNTSGASAATLPGINAGITVRNGVLVQDGSVLANHIELHAGALHPGMSFQLSASAHLTSGSDYSLQLDTTPRKNAHRIAFDPLQLTLTAGSGAHMELHGKADWAGGADIHSMLEGSVRTASKETYMLSIASKVMTRNQPAQVHLTVQGKGLDADLRVPPVRLASWWQQVSGPAGDNAGLGTPPITGTLHADHVQAGGVSISGLQVQSGPDVPAASSSATTTSGKAGTP